MVAIDIALGVKRLPTNIADVRVGKLLLGFSLQSWYVFDVWSWVLRGLLCCMRTGSPIMTDFPKMLF